MPGRPGPAAGGHALADVLLGTTPALTNRSGVAVYQNGTWKVGDASFCGLLALENGGKPPSVCSSAG